LHPEKSLIKSFSTCYDVFVEGGGPNPGLPHSEGHGGEASASNQGQKQNPRSNPNHRRANSPGGSGASRGGDPPSKAENHRLHRARRVPSSQAQGVRGPYPPRSMEHKRVDQVRAVGGIAEGFQTRAFRLGESAGGGLQEPHSLAQVCGGRDEERVLKARAQRVGPRRHASSEGRSVMV